uniref:Adenylate isopentenyltransferase n=1 Tax=Salix viminalis TaxID=40686 RepID=A0A6N2KZZ5_SALVM
MAVDRWFNSGCHVNLFVLKQKALLVLGTTATGKSKLSIDLATHFQGEIINSDKIQVYKGLDILTNKIHRSTCRDPLSKFKDNYDPCLILFDRAAKRVDEMLTLVLLTRDGSQQRDLAAIGIPELEPYFQAEMEMADELTKKILLDTGIKEMKENTKKLIEKQLRKIRCLANEKGWKLHRIDATCVYERNGKVDEDVWDDKVLRPSMEMSG